MLAAGPLARTPGSSVPALPAKPFHANRTVSNGRRIMPQEWLDQLFAPFSLACSAWHPMKALGQGDRHTQSRASCIERLDAPIYPPIARQARITGEFMTSVRLDANSRVTTVSSEIVGGDAKAKKLLAATIERSVRSAPFARDCESRTVTLLFRLIIGSASGVGIDPWNPRGAGRRNARS